MIPINNATEISPLISDEFLKEKYGITEEYSKEYPEDSVMVLSVVRSSEEGSSSSKRNSTI